jgi:hypothetical protein
VIRENPMLISPLARDVAQEVLDEVARHSSVLRNELWRLKGSDPYIRLVDAIAQRIYDAYEEEL